MRKPCKLVLTFFAIAISILGMTAGSAAQADGQTTFSSSQKAVAGLIAALRNYNATQLQAILGPGSEQIISSGDDVMDKSGRDAFVAKYDAKHALIASGKNQYTLNVGKDDWPLPIPLVDAQGKWYFDGAAGKEELLYRRIGRNELAAIKVCEGVVSAQHDYAAQGHDGNPAGAYATRVLSEPGKQNGLYWEVSEGQPPSPAGPLLAQAAEEGYSSLASGSNQPTPYHGYYYHMLKDPKGFGFVAYPAEYRSSGVMTFLVSQSGVVYQKDLGDNTAQIAKGMTDYKVDKTWTVVK